MTHKKMPSTGTIQQKATHHLPNLIRENGITAPADVQVLLSRLDKVKQTRKGAWVACCPAHDDKHPSMGVTLTDDGVVLLKCWAGCGAADIVAAVGLSLSDLFPKREPDDWSKPIAPGQRWVPRDVLTCVAREARICAIAATRMANGAQLSHDDANRLRTAAGLLSNAAKEVGA